MFKNIAAIIALSLLVIFFMSAAQQVLTLLVNAHDWVAEALKQVFSVGEVGNVIRQLLALLAIPVLVSLVPVLIYWLAKHSWFPWTAPLIWMVWLIQTSAIVVLYTPPK